MAELADALDSGSSGHYVRAGSSPVIRIWKGHCRSSGLFLSLAFKGQIRRKENEFGQNQKMDAFLLFDWFVLRHLYDFYRGLFWKKPTDVDRHCLHCGSGVYLFSPWGLLSLWQTPAYTWYLSGEILPLLSGRFSHEFFLCTQKIRIKNGCFHDWKCPFFLWRWLFFHTYAMMKQRGDCRDIEETPENK